jgi:hypothetical protein
MHGPGESYLFNSRPIPESGGNLLETLIHTFERLRNCPENPERENPQNGEHRKKKSGKYQVVSSYPGYVYASPQIVGHLLPANLKLHRRRKDFALMCHFHQTSRDSKSANVIPRQEQP